MIFENYFRKFRILNAFFHLNIFIVFLFCISCQYLEKPKNFLSEEQMAEILLDMAILDDAKQTNSDVKAEEVYKHILARYNINVEDYTENYAYYISQKKIKHIISLAEKKLMKKDPDIQTYITKKTDGI